MIDISLSKKVYSIKALIPLTIFLKYLKNTRTNEKIVNFAF